MIELHHLDGQTFMVNADLIETVHQSPDTVVLLTSGRRLLVQESPEEVVRRVTAFRRAVLAR